VDVLLQRAARARAAHRIGRLPPAPQGEMMNAKRVRLKPDTTYVVVGLAVFFVLSLFVVSGLSRTLLAQANDLDPRITTLVAGICEERRGAIRKKLESSEPRSTLSAPASSPRGVAAARQWIFNEMKSYSSKLQVSFDTYQLPPQGRITRPVELRNVMAILPG